MQLAQQTLRKTFGMELVELQRVPVGGGGAAIVDDTEKNKDKDKDGKKSKKKEKEKIDAVGMKKKGM